MLNGEVMIIHLIVGSIKIMSQNTYKNDTKKMKIYT